MWDLWKVSSECIYLTYGIVEFWPCSNLNSVGLIFVSEIFLISTDVASMSRGPFSHPLDDTHLNEILNDTLKDIQKPTTVSSSELLIFHACVWSFLFCYFFSYLWVCGVHAYVYACSHVCGHTCARIISRLPCTLDFFHVFWEPEPQSCTASHYS